MQRVQWLVSLLFFGYLMAAANASDHGHTKAILAREAIPNIPHPYTHPADVCELRDGTLAVIYNGGVKEAQPGNKVWLTRKPPTGEWTTPAAVEDNPDNKAIDIGVIFQPKRKDAPLLCYYWYGLIAPRPHNCTPCVRVSPDGGKTWGPRIHCPPSPGGQPWDDYTNGKWLMGPMQCAPVEMPDGSLIASGHLQKMGAKATRTPIIRIPPTNYTGDQADQPKWEVLSVQPNKGTGMGFGGFLILSKDRTHLALVGRGSLDGPHTICESKDAGKTWTDFKYLPRCGGAGVGTLSLDVDGGACHGWHVVAGSGGGKGLRNGLTVAISKTPLDPQSWVKALILHVNEGGEDADPTLIQTRDRKIHLVFTGRTQKGGIQHYMLDPNELIQAPGDAVIVK